MYVAKSGQLWTLFLLVRTAGIWWYLDGVYIDDLRQNMAIDSLRLVTTSTEVQLEKAVDMYVHVMSSRNSKGSIDI